jgi:hypothetical protein
MMGVSVGVGVSVGLGVAVGVQVGVWVSVGVEEAATVGVVVGLWLGIAVGVGSACCLQLARTNTRIPKSIGTLKLFIFMSWGHYLLIKLGPMLLGSLSSR